MGLHWSTEQQLRFVKNEFQLTINFEILFISFQPSVDKNNNTKTL